MLSVQTLVTKWWSAIIGSVVCDHNFSFKKFQGLVFSCSCSVSMWQISFEGFVPCSVAAHHTYKTGSENVSHSKTIIYVPLLVYFVKCSPFFAGHLRVFCLIIGSSPFHRRSPVMMFVFHSFSPRLACELIKMAN